MRERGIQFICASGCMHSQGINMVCAIVRHLTLYCANLGHQGADVLDREPVGEALAPHQRVLVNDAIHPRLTQHREGAGTARGAKSVPASARRESVWEHADASDDMQRNFGEMRRMQLFIQRTYSTKYSLLWRS